MRMYTLCMYMCIYIYICFNVRIYICVCADMQIKNVPCMYLGIYVCNVRMRTHACMYICMHVCTCMYVHMCIHVYVCRLSIWRHTQMSPYSISQKCNDWEAPHYPPYSSTLYKSPIDRSTQNKSVFLDDDAVFVVAKTNQPTGRNRSTSSFALGVSSLSAAARRDLRRRHWCVKRRRYSNDAYLCLLSATTVVDRALSCVFLYYFN